MAGKEGGYGVLWNFVGLSLADTPSWTAARPQGPALRPKFDGALALFLVGFAVQLLGVLETEEHELRDNFVKKFFTL